MARVSILRPFMVQLESGASVPFFAGGEYVPDEFMALAIVQANIEHSGGTPAAPAPAPATELAAAATDVEPIIETAEEIAADARLASEGVTREALLDKAKTLGLPVDGRWGMARLQAEIEKAGK